MREPFLSSLKSHSSKHFKLPNDSDAHDAEHGKEQSGTSSVCYYALASGTRSRPEYFTLLIKWFLNYSRMENSDSDFLLFFLTTTFFFFEEKFGSRLCEMPADDPNEIFSLQVRCHYVHAQKRFFAGSLCMIFFLAHWRMIRRVANNCDAQYPCQVCCMAHLPQIAAIIESLPRCWSDIPWLSKFLTWGITIRLCSVNPWFKHRRKKSFVPAYDTANQPTIPGFFMASYACNVLCSLIIASQPCIYQSWASYRHTKRYHLSTYHVSFDLFIFSARSFSGRTSKHASWGARVWLLLARARSGALFSFYMHIRIHIHDWLYSFFDGAPCTILTRRRSARARSVLCTRP